SAFVAADHLLRGYYAPQSVYGVITSDSWRWVEHTGWVIFEDVFLILSCFHSLREMRSVAERQAQLEACAIHLTESEESIRLVVDNALDAVITIGEDGCISGWNAQAEIIFGWNALEVLEQRLSEVIIPVAYREAHEQGVQRFLETGAGAVLNRR